MIKRRSRLFREDVLAPWITLAVIGVVWWLGARALSPATPDTPATTEAAAPVATVTDKAPASPNVVRPEPKPSAPEVSPPANRLPSVDHAANEALTPLSESPAREVSSAKTNADVETLLAQRPLIPVAGIEAKHLASTFEQARGGGSRVHEAMDILAPKGTPVFAVVEGKVAKLFTSAAGGLTIYQYDPTEKYCYYYAHLDRYAPGLVEGQQVSRGQVVGYVGVTGNAPPDTPHLHFAIFKLGADKKWWKGDPIDPFLVLR
ncbi:MAG TPA: peptidoglycan DD-metalloendopeptidase family protein [Vicinamibacterales bacterium]|nr:peptidoglycan DD-metalloendopeptidase family protein [Vicinamibacterales bacterium]